MERHLLSGQELHFASLLRMSGCLRDHNYPDEFFVVIKVKYLSQSLLDFLLLCHMKGQVAQCVTS